MLNRRHLKYVLTFCVVLISCAPTIAPHKTCGNYPDPSESKYVLPYAVGATYKVIQGNCESPGSVWTHYDRDRYAYDFEMPIGTEVIAAREGIVIFVRDEFTDADHGADQGNAIVILHPDSTIALYGHFTHEGARVVVGQNVRQGEVIGLSGNSGQSPIPHLHFQLNERPDFSTSETVPVVFRNVSPQTEILEKDMTYTATP